MIVRITHTDAKMIVCHCKGITDRDIRAAVLEGHQPASEDFSRACPAGTDCGGCRPLVDALLRDAEGNAESRASSKTVY